MNNLFDALPDTDTEDATDEASDEASDDEASDEASDDSDDSDDESEDIDNADTDEDAGIRLVDNDNDNEDDDVDEDKALADIRKLQDTTDFLIPLLNFNRVVREIAEDYKTDLRFTKNAILALQTEAEAHVISLFELSQKLALHAKRVGVQPKDISLAVHVRNM